MFIISHSEAFVKWSSKKAENVAVAHKMIEAGFRKRGYQMLDCGKFIETRVCPDCGKSFISSAMLCRDRMCPTCQWRLSLKRFAEMCATLSAITDLGDYHSAFLTLTVKNCKPGELRETIREMSKAWNRLLQRVTFKKHVAGWARSVEVTYNEERKTFHPHFHCILLTDGYFSEGGFHSQFRKEWQEVMQVDYEPITDFQWIRDRESRVDNDTFVKAILETFKYISKTKLVVTMPTDVFRKYVNGISGLRLASYGGVIKDMRKELQLAEDEEIEEESRLVCDCGAELRVALLQWSFESGMYNLVKEAVQVQAPEEYQEIFCY